MRLPGVDKRYDFASCQQYLKKEGSRRALAAAALRAKNGRAPPLDRRAHSWLVAGFGKLRVRLEPRLAIQAAMLSLVAAAICSRS